MEEGVPVEGFKLGGYMARPRSWEDGFWGIANELEWGEKVPGRPEGTRLQESRRERRRAWTRVSAGWTESKGALDRL